MSELPEKPSALDDRARRALSSDRTIDITTTGRRSGRPRRIEIWFHNLGGRIYISGLPGQRDWYANLVAHPEFVFHLKGTVQIDLPARARLVTDPPERRHLLHELLAGIGREADLESWAATSPIIEVHFDHA